MQNLEDQKMSPCKEIEKNWSHSKLAERKRLTTIHLFYTAKERSQFLANEIKNKSEPESV